MNDVNQCFDLDHKVFCKSRDVYPKRGKKYTSMGDRFGVEICIDRHKAPDPAGLCDRVSYCKSLQIRLEEDGTVACFWNEFEHGSSMECVYDVPYEVFFKFMLPTLRRLKKKYAKVKTS